MIDLNQSATTYPKPSSVIEAVNRTLLEQPQSQFRGAVTEQENVERLCRRNLAQLFHIGNPERIYFTSGSTQALNLAILGFWRERDKRGNEKEKSRRRLVLTATEHNSVLRTVYDGLGEEIAAGAVEPVVVPCDGSGYVDMTQLKEAVTDQTGMVIVNHSSNVTGAVQQIAQIGALAHRKGACFLVDASQSAGVLPIDVEEMEIDLMAFTAHKSLFGIQGCGGLYVREGIRLRPLMYGGTGTDSAILVPKEPFYEVGTANLPGIAALNAGVEFILSEGPEKILEHDRELMKRLYEGLRTCPGVKVYADRQPEGTALSFTLKGLSPADTGYILAGSYGIVVRTGLHCAPLIHPYLGCGREGTVRVSISYMNRVEETEEFLDAVRQLAAGIG